MALDKIWRKLIIGFLLAMGVALNLYVASQMISP